MAKKKHNKKNKPVPCSDANQHVKQHAANVKKQNDYIIRKIAEYRAKQMAAAGKDAAAALDTKTILTPDKKPDETTSQTI